MEAQVCLGVTEGRIPPLSPRPLQPRGHTHHASRHGVGSLEKPSRGSRFHDEGYKDDAWGMVGPRPPDLQPYFSAHFHAHKGRPRFLYRLPGHGQVTAQSPAERPQLASPAHTPPPPPPPPPPPRECPWSFPPTYPVTAEGRQAQEDEDKPQRERWRPEEERE